MAVECNSARGGGGGGAAVGAMPLPPPPRLAGMSSSSPASIRALLARTASGSSGGGVDCQSPRSLLSRILQRGDGGGGFGCRVRLPRRYFSSSAAAAAGSGREERKDCRSEHADSTPRLKIVERAPELPLETPRSSLGKKNLEEELMAMNLGMGASLVLLLSKSAVELNKMVELRAQMEAMVSELRQLTQRKEKPSSTVSSGHESNDGSTSCTTTVIMDDPIARAASEDAPLSNCSRSTAPLADHRAARLVVPGHVVTDLIEAELDRMQTQRAHHGGAGEERAAVPTLELGLADSMHGRRALADGERVLDRSVDRQLPSLQVKTRSVDAAVSGSPSRSCFHDDEGKVDDDGGAGEEEDVADDDEEEEEEYDDDEEEDGGDDDGVVVDCKSPPHGGVSARALERRLHEVLQRRQQERIVELESALDTAQRRLHEREREVVWWRDAANLVSHRRDESRRLIGT